MNKKNVDNILDFFLGFLNDSWPRIENLFCETGNDIFKLDWLQANWETIVEASVCEKFGPSIRLEVYGEGAEANGDSSRILFPADIPNYKIVCSVKSKCIEILKGRPISPGQTYQFDKFVSLKNSWYIETSPFTHVLLIDQNNHEKILPREKVEFFLIEI